MVNDDKSITSTEDNFESSRIPFKSTRNSPREFENQ